VVLRARPEKKSAPLVGELVKIRSMHRPIAVASELITCVMAGHKENVGAGMSKPLGKMGIACGLEGCHSDKIPDHRLMRNSKSMGCCSLSNGWGFLFSLSSLRGRRNQNAWYAWIPRPPPEARPIIQLRHKCTHPPRRQSVQLPVCRSGDRVSQRCIRTTILIRQQSWARWS
jgi:hypothetical protein